MRCCKACGCYLPDGVYVCFACGYDENKPLAPAKVREPYPTTSHFQHLEHVRVHDANNDAPQELDVEVMWRQDDEGIWYGDVIQTARDIHGNLLGVQVIGKRRSR